MLQAPPGAGKTTLVPLALLGAPWLGDRTIVMLEPRRLATRAAAYRIAELHGEAVGNTIGYRMRGDSNVSRRSRIEVVTEGILTRRLQRDPTLDGVGVVIFDEFHERSLDADLGLALTRRTQQLVRDDLRILVMSATLDGQAVSRLLGDAPIVTSEGRAYPVETRYVSPRAGARIEATVVTAVIQAIREDPGDVLVFLPGAGEIRRVEQQLDNRNLDGAVVLPLYGAMTHDAQDRALRPDPSGRRKIVLSTSIAETSITIEGVRIVIDSGLSRAPRFSPRSGLTQLETVRVSRAAADQRRGRAGRLAPGVCYRCWPEHEHTHLLANAPAEITTADLAPLALELLAAGVADPGELDWIDPPAPAAYAGACELLRELGAVRANPVRADGAGSLVITEHGRAMSDLPVHPRLAHMLLRARAFDGTALACDIAALLSERDVLRMPGASTDADIAFRVHAMRRDASPTGLPAELPAELPAGAEVDRDTVRRARVEAERLARLLGVRRATGLEALDAMEHLGTLVALAYPDRVAQRRPGVRSRYVLRNGRGAELTGAQSLSEAPFIVAAELDDQRPESRVFLAAAITVEEVYAAFADQMEREDVIEFDDATDSVIARRRERLGAIVLRDVALGDPDPARVTAALVGGIRRRGVAVLPWPDAARRFRERMAFAERHLTGWPAVTDEALAASLELWLVDAVADVRRLADVSRVDLVAALSTLLDWKQRVALDEVAPTHLEVPSGSRITVDYTNPDAPVLAVRIQEVFGLVDSPRIANGRVAVTMHLLSPAHRPVQVTQDLAGFWRTSYFDVRKELRGRYPRHEWPENPLEATPTRRAKPRT